MDSANSLALVREVENFFGNFIPGDQKMVYAVDHLVNRRFVADWFKENISNTCIINGYVYENRHVIFEILVEDRFIFVSRNILVRKREYYTPGDVYCYNKQLYLHILDSVQDGKTVAMLSPHLTLKNRIIVDSNTTKENFLNDLDEKICPISHEEITNPVETNCKHVFEKDLIMKYIETEDHCPMCRTFLGYLKVYK